MVGNTDIRAGKEGHALLLVNNRVGTAETEQGEQPVVKGEAICATRGRYRG